MLPRNPSLAVLGLGYVGLSLAVAFARHYPVIGYDRCRRRLEELGSGFDRYRMVPEEALQNPNLRLSAKEETLGEANVYIIAVPTPVDRHKIPDLSALKSASETVGQVLKRGDVVIYESTVFPGCTEELCVPILEEVSGLKLNRDFGVGYSPERINPGDPEHTLESIVKITSGSTPEVAAFVDELYRKIVQAGTYCAPDIRTAEAAKVIENIQRDVNIALMNELSVLFHKLGLDTHEVLQAASTKWNFLPFRPGLVGGHCIGVDPYYLTYKAREIGHHPEIILAGRRINDAMGRHVADRVLHLMLKHKITPFKAEILILGVTFKENCPDLRNTRVVELFQALKASGAEVDLYDPWISSEEVEALFGQKPLSAWPEKPYNVVVLAVAHRQFEAEKVLALRRPGGILFDVKGVLPKDKVDGRL